MIVIAVRSVNRGIVRCWDSKSRGKVRIMRVIVVIINDFIVKATTELESHRLPAGPPFDLIYDTLWYR